MKKIRLLLLDTCVVIELFRLNLWASVLEKCEILLARTGAENEVKYYHGTERDRIIDLSPYTDSGRVAVVDVQPSDLQAFRDQFSLTYLARLDDGEAESLAYLLTSKDLCSICSSDAIVYKVLACLNYEERGLSLESVLKTIGLGRKLADQFTEAFREKWTRQGKQDGIRGTARRG